MKKVPVFLLVILMLFACVPFALAADAAVTVNGAELESGEKTELSVDIQSNPGLAAWMFEVTWDEELMSLDKDSVKMGEGFSDGSMIVNDTQPGKLIVTWYCVKNVSADGQLFAFSLNADKAGNCPVNISCSEVNTIDVKGNPVKVSTSGAKVTIQGDETSVPPVSVTPPAPKPEDSVKLQFSDVKAGQYFYDAVMWAAENNITTGTGGSFFSPDTTCTRAQTVTFLWRAAGCPEPENYVNQFKDVKAGAYYSKAVLWAVEQGITNGISKDKFGPDETVSRAQVVTFLWRMAGSVKTEGNGFEDVKEGKYYFDAVEWAVGMDITNGTSKNAFSPDAGCTRAQIVTFLYRFFVR